MPFESTTKVYTVTQALPKAQKYCAYQERSQSEVRNKISEWGLKPEEIEFIISELIGDNFINEERFAKLFAGGKFRIKKWGRIKIKQELKRKAISEYCIKQALREINESDYIFTLTQLLQKKWKETKVSNPLVRKHKVTQYAFSRGFEIDLIEDVLKTIMKQR
jgi:regulatory protein